MYQRAHSITMQHHFRGRMKIIHNMRRQERIGGKEASPEFVRNWYEGVEEYETIYNSRFNY